MEEADSSTSARTHDQHSKIPAKKVRRQAHKSQPMDGLREVVATVREGDGVDPRDEAKRKHRALKLGRAGRERGAHRKERFTAQLKEAIDSGLQLAVNPILNTLTVREVVQQGGSYLVVTEPRDPAVPLDVAAASETLKKASSMLSLEIARTITRKKVPVLSFIVLPAGAERTIT